MDEVAENIPVAEEEGGNSADINVQTESNAKGVKVVSWLALMFLGAMAISSVNEILHTPGFIFGFLPTFILYSSVMLPMTTGLELIRRHNKDSNLYKDLKKILVCAYVLLIVFAGCMYSRLFFAQQEEKTHYSMHPPASNARVYVNGIGLTPCSRWTDWRKFESNDSTQFQYIEGIVTGAADQMAKDGFELKNPAPVNHMDFVDAECIAHPNETIFEASRALMLQLAPEYFQWRFNNSGKGR